MCVFSTPLDQEPWDQSVSQKLNLLVTAGEGGWLVIFRCLLVNAPVSHCFICGEGVESSYECRNHVGGAVKSLLQSLQAKKRS